MNFASLYNYYERLVFNCINEQMVGQGRPDPRSAMMQNPDALARFIEAQNGPYVPAERFASVTNPAEEDPYDGYDRGGY